MVMFCVRSVSFSVLLNGSPLTDFRSVRGLRQVDPLLPYQFILCLEVHSKLIDREQVPGHIYGVRIASSAIPINHLMFADDTFLFCKGSLNEVEALMRCVAEYEAWLGQRVRRTVGPISRSYEIRFAAGLRDGRPDCYLGVGRGQDKGRYFVWKDWNLPCKPKALRGLGFQKFSDFNLALLSKLAWNLLFGKSGVCNDILKQKYLKEVSLWDVEAKGSDSFVGHGILDVKNLVVKGGFYLVGDGSHLLKFGQDLGFLPWNQAFLEKLSIQALPLLRFSL
ncbi:uncharacterized protein LOC112093870 [Morus notabilis]|uniref:uncharacterized protein LOC112093870 n=1 Tax=Morus notabilis TaxID=981085 RepID=UPI000CED74E2|nr:uncharacterized protein LOC112093870 [Morus notabilis]